MSVQPGGKGDRSNLPERPEGCFAQIGPVPFSASAQPDWLPELHDLLDRLQDGDFTESDRLRLNELLDAGSPQRQYFITYMDVHSRLAWEGGRELRDAGPPEFPAPSRESAAPGPAPLVPPIIIDDFSPAASPSFSSLLAPGGWIFSYGVSAVIVGLAVLTAAVWTVSHEYGVARIGPRPAVQIAESPPEIVGRITGMAGCHWSDPDDAPLRTAFSVGGKYALDSGLLEISYNTGAKVILQGPCTYEVESASGGFLALGKLTARVEKGSGGKGQGSVPSPLSPLPSPFFVVRTPTAVVTDLGTEFGVEVTREGNTISHVFRGSVNVQVAGIKAPQRMVRLEANESVRVEASPDRATTAITVNHQPYTFSRRMPGPVWVPLFNTGVGLKAGQADPHWQLVARSDDPHFKPRPAVVTAPDPRFWLANDPRRSQWISAADGPPLLPNGVVYTFRATFEVVGALPDAAVLRGLFIADNHVQAVRLNGKEAYVPTHADSHFDDFNIFTVDKDFVEGTNVLEIDVLNGSLRQDPAEKTGPMGLRVELSWTVSSGRKDSAGAARLPAAVGAADAPRPQWPARKEGVPVK